MDALLTLQRSRVKEAGQDTLASEYVSADEFMSAVEQLRSEADAQGLSGMTMEEIDEEIAACRKERMARKGR